MYLDPTLVNVRLAEQLRSNGR